MFANTEAFFILTVYSLIIGACLGLFYDTLMTVADAVFPSKMVKIQNKRPLGADLREAERSLFPYKWKFGAREILFLVFDVMFWSISAVTVIILLYHLNYGQIRAFSLFCALGGFLICRKTIGKPIRFIVKWALKKLLFILKKAFSILRKLIVFLLKPAKKLIGKFVMPEIEKRSLVKKRRKTRKYLALMQENEIKLRKIKNERSKGIGSDR